MPEEQPAKSHPKSRDFPSQDELSQFFADKHCRRVVLPEGIQREIYRTLFDELGRTLTAASVRRVYRRIRSRSKVDYQRDSAAFAYLYYGANFAKVFLSVLPVLADSLNRPTKIVDLGTGSGSSLAGVLAAFKSFGLPIAQVTAVDSSSIQLRLFDRITRPWIEQDFPNLSIRSETGTVVRFVDPVTLDRDTLVLASYVGCEMNGQRSEFEDYMNELSKHCNVLLVDQLPNRSGTFISFNGREWSRLQTDKIQADVGEIATLPLPMAPKFVSAPRKPVLPRVIRDYFRAWENHNIEMLRRIFSSDAVYEINKYAEKRILLGVEQIVRYWKRNAKFQRKVSWNVEPAEVRRHAKGLSFPWRANFIREDKNSRYDLKGSMILHIKGKKIDRLMERYAVDRQPLQPPHVNSRSPE